MKTFKTVKEAHKYSTSNPSETIECKLYFDDGQLRHHSFYLDSNRHGEFKMFSSNGQLREYCFYVNDSLHGEYKSYFKHGQLRSHSFYVNGKKIKLDHLKDSSYKSLCIKHTLFNGNIHDI